MRKTFLCLTLRCIEPGIFGVKLLHTNPSYYLLICFFDTYVVDLKQNVFKLTKDVLNKMESCKNTMQTVVKFVFSFPQHFFRILSSLYAGISFFLLKYFSRSALSEDPCISKKKNC